MFCNDNDDNDDDDDVYKLEYDDPNYENKLRVILDKDKLTATDDILIVIESGNYKGFTIMMEKYKTFENTGIEDYAIIDSLLLASTREHIKGDALKMLYDLIHKYNFKPYYSTPNKFNHYTYCFHENKEMLKIICDTEENVEIALRIARSREMSGMVTFLYSHCKCE